MLVGKGISADEIFSVINSRDPVICTVDKLANMDSESDVKFQSNLKSKVNENNSSQRKLEIIKSVGTSFAEFDSIKEITYNGNGNGNINGNFCSLSSLGYSNIRNRKELNHFLHKKRKEYNLDSSVLKEHGLERRGVKEANSELNSKLINNATSITVKEKDYTKSQGNNSLSLKETNGGKAH